MLKLITDITKTYGLKTTRTFKKQIRIPLRLTIGSFSCRQRKSKLNKSKRRQSIEKKSRRNEEYSNKKLKNNSVVVRSVLDSHCQRFRETVIREKFKLKQETRIKNSFK